MTNGSNSSHSKGLFKCINVNTEQSLTNSSFHVLYHSFNFTWVTAWLSWLSWWTNCLLYCFRAISKQIRLKCQHSNFQWLCECELYCWLHKIIIVTIQVQVLKTKVLKPIKIISISVLNSTIHGLRLIYDLDL